MPSKSKVPCKINRARRTMPPVFTTLTQALYYGIFHSISAFCNAGFDLMGAFGMSSFIGYNTNWIVCITLMALIFIGGIGFFVWGDLKEHKLHIRKYALHTKIVLITSLILIIGPSILFLILERHALFADMNTPQAILNALFCAVTPRTAGFNTTDIASLSQSSQLLTIILMFIGGCPGSTAGGAKVTTITVLILYLRSMLTRTDGVNIFKRRLEDEAVSKAAAVFTTHMLLAVAATFLISMQQYQDDFCTGYKMRCDTGAHADCADSGYYVKYDHREIQILLHGDQKSCSHGQQHMGGKYSGTCTTAKRAYQYRLNRIYLHKLIFYRKDFYYEIIFNYRYGAFRQPSVPKPCKTRKRGYDH